MARPLRGLITLTRPGNAFMAAAGALAGGLAAPAATHWSSLAAGMVASVLGVAGGNALNDAADADIDRHAHPKRPIPRGDLDVPAARAAAVWFFALSLSLLSLTNSSALVLGVLFVGGLVVYESSLKKHGLVGNLTISVLVGGTFLLGALTAQTPLMSFGAAPLDVGLAAVAMALLAAIVNLAREIYKDLQDAAYDEAWRHTLPHRFGADVSYALARTSLGLGVVLGLAPAGLHVLPPLYAVFVLPALTVFAVTLFVKDPTRASFYTKLGMALALFAFVAAALI